VNAPYDHYVAAATRFWNASGFDVSVGANGFDLRVESALAFLAGGVAFDAPPDASAEEPAAANTAFRLYTDRAAAMAQPDTLAARYVLYFTESIRGLSVGAPVTFIGFAVGEVTDVGLDIEPATLEVRSRVEIATYLNRFLARLKHENAAAFLATTAERHGLVESLVERRGLRAQLRSGNLITGQLYVALDYFPDAPPAKIDWTQEPPQLPVMPSNVAALEARLTAILTKLEKLPLEEIGNDARKSLVTLNKTLADADAIVQHFNTEVTPEVRATLAEARRTLSADSPLQLDTRSALREVSQAARALRVLADYLERHPGALIFGKGKPTQSETAPATSQEEPQQ
jgi:paraquat-inducible protein B